MAFFSSKDSMTFTVHIKDSSNNHGVVTGVAVGLLLHCRGLPQRICLLVQDEKTKHYLKSVYTRYKHSCGGSRIRSFW